MLFLMQDLLFSIRSLWRSKSFSLIAILTLALWAGANTAIFSLLNAALLRPLLCPQSEQLITLCSSYPGLDSPKASASGTNYRGRSEATDVFDEVGLVNEDGFNIGEEQDPQRVKALSVTPWCLGRSGSLPTSVELS